MTKKDVLYRKQEEVQMALSYLISKPRGREREIEREKVIDREKWKRATDINESRVETDSVPLWCEN